LRLAQELGCAEAGLELRHTDGGRDADRLLAVDELDALDR
jgi:hypothetical protein